jgi:hypothetical protein
MVAFTVISEHGGARIDATVDGARVLVDPPAVESALGWHLEPQGLCRGDVCVPVRDRLPAGADGRVDLVAAAQILERAVVLDAAAGVLVVGVRASERRRALGAHELPPFSLPDLDGTMHTTSEWRGKKKLLVAFASW